MNNTSKLHLQQALDQLMAKPVIDEHDPSNKKIFKQLSRHYYQQGVEEGLSTLISRTEYCRRQLPDDIKLQLPYFSEKKTIVTIPESSLRVGLNDCLIQKIRRGFLSCPNEDKTPIIELKTFGEALHLFGSIYNTEQAIYSIFKKEMLAHMNFNLAKHSSLEDRKYVVYSFSKNFKLPYDLKIHLFDKRIFNATTFEFIGNEVLFRKISRVYSRYTEKPKTSLKIVINDYKSLLSYYAICQEKKNWKEDYKYIFSEIFNKELLNLYFFATDEERKLVQPIIYKYANELYNLLRDDLYLETQSDDPNQESETFAIKSFLWAQEPFFCKKIIEAKHFKKEKIFVDKEQIQKSLEILKDFLNFD